MFVYISILLILLIIFEVYEILRFKRLWYDLLPASSPKNYKPYIIGLVSLFILLLNIKLAIGLFLLFVINISQNKRKKNKKKQKIIGYYGYKIFKFLMNQTSSGIKISDALQGLYQIVDDNDLRRYLIDVSACFRQTADLHQSLEILKTHYKGIEVQTLCVAIEQGIDTGCNYETLVKMEGLLFKKYIYQIQKDTTLRKKRGVLATLYLCIIVVLMVAVPILIDMLSAFNKIFY